MQFVDNYQQRVVGARQVMEQKWQSAMCIHNKTMYIHGRNRAKANNNLP